MERFASKKMLKVGNKVMTVVCYTCSKLPIGTQNSAICFHFEQISVRPVVSLLLTFNNYTVSGVLYFSIHHFCFNI